MENYVGFQAMPLRLVVTPDATVLRTPLEYVSIVPLLPTIVAVLPDHAIEKSPFVVTAGITERLAPLYDSTRPPALPISSACVPAGFQAMNLTIVVAGYRPAVLNNDDVPLYLRIAPFAPEARAYCPLGFHAIP